MPEGYIYVITNSCNGKVYVGSSKSIDNRLKSHKSQLNKRNHINSHLQSAWDKYGKDNFEFKIIEKNIPETKLFEREQFWIERYNSLNPDKGYNLKTAYAGDIKSEKGYLELDFTTFKTIVSKEDYLSYESGDIAEKINDAVYLYKRPYEEIFKQEDFYKRTERSGIFLRFLDEVIPKLEIDRFALVLFKKNEKKNSKNKYVPLRRKDLIEIIQSVLSISLKYARFIYFGLYYAEFFCTFRMDSKTYICLNPFLVRLEKSAFVAHDIYEMLNQTKYNVGLSFPIKARIKDLRNENFHFLKDKIVLED